MLFQGVGARSGLVYQHEAFSADIGAFWPPGSFERIRGDPYGTALGSLDAGRATGGPEGSRGGNNQGFPVSIEHCFLLSELSYKMDPHRFSAADPPLDAG